MRIDLHTHSTISDGTDTPTGVVLNARAAGLDAVALTDHDTFDGLSEAMLAASRIGVEVLAGVEMSTRYQGRSVHLLGYGAKVDDASLNAELARIRQGRDGRLQAMADRLTELGYPLTVGDIMTAAGAAPSVGRPHVADAMLAKGYVASRDEAFARFIDDDGPAYVDRYATELPDAIDLLHAAGGVAVIAHPWGRGSVNVMTAEVLTELVISHQLDGIEVEHHDHTYDQRRLLHELGGRLGLVRTGGSDYHGTGKVDHDLGSATTRASALRELQRRVRERGGHL